MYANEVAVFPGVVAGLVILVPVVLLAVALLIGLVLYRKGRQQETSSQQEVTPILHDIKQKLTQMEDRLKNLESLALVGTGPGEFETDVMDDESGAHAAPRSGK